MDEKVTVWCFQIGLPLYLFLCDLTLWAGILMIVDGTIIWFKQISGNGDNTTQGEVPESG